jgi:hypothetical protein
MKHWLGPLLVGAFSTSAGAEPLHPSVEVAVGYRSGGAIVEGVDVGHVRGGHIDAGVRLLPRLLLYGEYDLTGLTYPAPDDRDGAARIGVTSPTGSTGLQHRVGANARYTFDRLGASDVGLAFWAEGGPGIEHYVWDSGGVWTRPDFAIGLGTTSWVRVDHKYSGISFAVRATFAPKNSVGTAVSCGGPCDSATTASGWDRSVMWDLSMLFGR